MPITREQFDKLIEEGFTVEEIAEFDQRSQGMTAQPQQQPQQENILQQLLQATQNTIGNIAGGIIQPPAKIIGRAGQGISGMLGGSMQPYQIPMPTYLGGNIPIEPAQSLSQALGPVAQTTAMAMGGSPILAGATYGAGMGMEEKGSGLDIAGKAALGGLVGTVGQKLMGKPVLPEKLRTFFKYDNALKRSATAKVGLDKVRTTVGQAKRLAIRELADVPVEAKPIGKNVPQIAIDEIRKPEHNVEFLQDGSLKPTIGNMDKVKDALGDLIGTKPMAWKEASKAAKRQIINTYFEIRNLMVNAAEKVGKDISKPLEAYHKFMINYNKINPALVDKNNQIVANKLKAAFKWSAEPAYKQAWQDVSKASPEIKSVMNSMNRREILKNLLKISGAVVAVGLGKTALDWTTK